MIQFDTLQKTGKDGFDAAVKSLSAISRGSQSAALETMDFAKRNFEQGTSLLEKLMGARTVERAFEVQGEYVRTSYEGLVAQATKMGELVAATAKDVYGPVEGFVARNAATSAAAA